MGHSTSYRRILHKMGYYDYQHGLIFRHLNQENGWNHHLEKCRSFILNAVDNIKPRKVTILGSGWLLEVPIAELAERIEKISLVDIVHPPEVVSQTSGMKNVEIIEQDISGGLIEKVWEKAGKVPLLKKPGSIEDIIVPEYHFSDDPGLVISLNILTQLEILPERFLRKKSKTSEEEFIRFRKDVQQKHISSVINFRSVIITDTKEVSTAADGTVSERITLLAELPKGSYSEAWTWDFDLKKTDYNRKRSVMNVIGIVV